MFETTHLFLPLIEGAQAQKHVTHNEALVLLDAAVHLAVLTRNLNAPPASPQQGDRHLVGTSPAGAWLGHAGDLAFYQDGAWRFAEPNTGWRIWSVAETKLIVFDGTNWRDAGTVTELQDMSLLGVNTTADAANRLAVSSPGVLFTHEGDDQRLKINKSAVGDTASMVFQDGFSGRAELGLTGDDDFHLKVSADGTAWNESYAVDRTTARLTFKQPMVIQPAIGDPASPANGTLWYNATTNTLRVRQNGATLDVVGGGGGATTAPVMADQTITFGRLTAVGAGNAGLKTVSGTYTSITLGTRTEGGNHFTASGDQIDVSTVPSDPLYRWTGCTVTGPDGTSNSFTLTIETYENARSFRTLAELSAAVTAIGTASAGPQWLYGRNANLGAVDDDVNGNTPFNNKAFVSTVTLTSHDPEDPLTFAQLQVRNTDNLTISGIKVQSSPGFALTSTSTYFLLWVTGPCQNILIDGNEICGAVEYDVLGDWSGGFWQNFTAIGCTDSTDYPQTVTLQNNYVHDVGRGLTLAVQSKGIIRGNRCLRYYQTGIQMTPPNAWSPVYHCAGNDIGLPFSLATDFNNPHCDGIYLHGASRTADWTGHTIEDNTIWEGHTRGNGQGIFAKGGVSLPLFGVRIRGNLVECGQVYAIALNGIVNTEISANTCVRSPGASVAGYGLIRAGKDDLGVFQVSGTNSVQNNIAAQYEIHASTADINNYTAANVDYRSVFDGPWTYTEGAQHARHLYRVKAGSTPGALVPVPGAIAALIPGGKSVADGGKGDIAVSGSGETWIIAADTITNAKLRDSAATSVIGRSAGTVGDPADIVGTADTALIMSGGTVQFQKISATQMNNSTVSNSKLTTMAAATIKGNNTGAAANPLDLTMVQATAMLDPFVASGASHAKGLVPDPGVTSGTTKFLREDATWAVPAGGGGSPGGANGDIQYNNAGAFGGFTMSGDGTLVAATGVFAIAAGAVSNTKLADVPTATFKGRVTAATGDPEDLTGTQATTLLDTFTTALKGLVPPSGGGTVNFLRADGTFAAPGGGGGSGDVVGPASATDNAITRFDTTTGKLIQNSGATLDDSGVITLPSAAIPAAPAADKGSLFILDRATRELPAFRAPVGAAYGLQRQLAHSRTALWMAVGNATTLSQIDTASSAAGTATTRNVATTNRFTQTRRVGYASAATAGSSSGVRLSQLQWYRGNAADKGGFYAVIRFGAADAAAVADARMFAGLYGTAAVIGNVNPSTLLNIIGVGADNADANLSIMHNDGAGAATEIALGANFPANTLSTDLYELTLFSAPNGATVEYRIERINTGNVATGSISTDLPSSTQLLAPQVWRNNGATALAAAVDIALIAVETEY